MPNKATDYDKKTPREHILTRPDTYIGDIEVTNFPPALQDLTTDVGWHQDYR